MFGLDSLLPMATGLLSGGSGSGQSAAPAGPNAGGGAGGQVFNGGSLFGPVVGSSGSALGGAGGSAAQGGTAGNGAGGSAAGVPMWAFWALAGVVIVGGILLFIRRK